MACRCDRETEGKHPCHGQGYTCERPGSIRFYKAKFVAIAGVQMKVQVSDTWACDECWLSSPPSSSGPGSPSMTLAAVLASFLLGTTCTAWLILCLAELRWRDPRFKGVHRPLNIISSYPRKGY